MKKQSWWEFYVDGFGGKSFKSCLFFYIVTVPPVAFLIFIVDVVFELGIGK